MISRRSQKRSDFLAVKWLVFVRDGALATKRKDRSSWRSHAYIFGSTSTLPRQRHLRYPLSFATLKPSLPSQADAVICCASPRSVFRQAPLKLSWWDGPESIELSEN